MAFCAGYPKPLSGEEKMNTIYYAPKAQNDLDEIYTYIAEKLVNPSAADHTVNGILDAVDMLQEYTEAGTPVYFDSDLFSGYRFVGYKNYLAFYRIIENAVYVDRILYKKRDYMQLLFPTE